ncbi:hypothetical protein GCM10010231_62700 [Streptomyces sindenensis]|nr:hypothetical protein GCM10010231_62700 [Streptomyces sindenensis]
MRPVPRTRWNVSEMCTITRHGRLPVVVPPRRPRCPPSGRWGGPLSDAEVVAAFEQTAAGIRERIRELGFSGTGAFYVWHDEQAGRLRCSTGSVPADESPFNGPYVVSGQLAPVVERFLADSTPGIVAWPDLDDAESRPEQAGAEPEIPYLRVRTSSVGTSLNACAVKPPVELALLPERRRGHGAGYGG